MTWLQILQAPRQGLGSETIKREAIQPPIPPHITPDKTTFLAFRFGDKARIIGYRDNQTLHIVWVDPEHKVYPS